MLASTRPTTGRKMVCRVEVFSTTHLPWRWGSMFRPASSSSSSSGFICAARRCDQACLMLNFLTSCDHAGMPAALRPCCWLACASPCCTASLWLGTGTSARALCVEQLGVRAALVTEGCVLAMELDG